MTLDKPKRLIGLKLKGKTINLKGQSSIDCGNLWQRFEKGGYFNKIPQKKNEAILAVYYNYEGDHNAPFEYFIGCEVEEKAIVPEGMDSLIIPEGQYQKFTAKGKMPVCISDAWQNIWASSAERAYHYDFEIYDKRSADWSNAEVDIFVSV